jgi:hypothetical protein
LPQELFWQALSASLVASIEAISFSISFGSGVHIPIVFGKGRLYIVSEGYCCFRSWCDGMEPKNLHMCGNLQWSDAGAVAADAWNGQILDDFILVYSVQCITTLCFFPFSLFCHAKSVAWTNCVISPPPRFGQLNR